MSICSYCYHRMNHNGFNVGEWWNNEPDMVKVCSQECKDKLWKMVQDGTWMDHKPEAMFPEYYKSQAEEVKQVTQNWANKEEQIRKGVPTALTDKQFGEI